MLAECHDAVSLIAALERTYPSHAINWESILAHQYGRCLDRPSTVVDVGANQGAHVAQLLALGAQRVVCFEPIPGLAERLRLVYAEKPVTVHQCALSTDAGRRTFHFNHDVPSESGLNLRIDSKAQHQIEKIEVVTASLDDFDLREVAYIKLDCEGAELDVLEGATETIRRSLPLISIEYGAASYGAYGRSKFDLLTWALAHRYVPSDLFGHRLATAETFGACVDRYYWDFFLIPSERIAAVEPQLRAGARAVFADFGRFGGS